MEVHTVLSEGLHIPLSVLSHCTMGQVGLSMGVYYPWESTVHGSPLSMGAHCPAVYELVFNILFHSSPVNFS